MILFISNNKFIFSKIATALAPKEIYLKHLYPSDGNFLSQLEGYAHLDLMIVDRSIESVSEELWLEAIRKMCRKHFLVLLGDELKFVKIDHGLSDCFIAKAPTVEQLLKIIEKIVLKKLIKNKKPSDIKVFNVNKPKQILIQDGVLSLFLIQTVHFSDLSIEFGHEIYQSLRDCFAKVLLEMHGSSGCFRTDDILQQRSSFSNDYYIFLEHSRKSQNIPKPGMLEHVAERLNYKLQIHLHDALHEISIKGKLSYFPKKLPEFGIGYASTLYNVATNPEELIDNLLKEGVKSAKIQIQRRYSRQKELIQYIIQSKSILYPHYQAIIDFRNLPLENFLEQGTPPSLYDFSQFIFGFESLIRINQKLVSRLMGKNQLFYINLNHFNPEVLFSLANASHVVLELDQKCLKLGIEYFVGLPGVLMLNIFPRNLYFIKQVLDLKQQNYPIVFEIAESEAIGNIKLMLQLKDKLKSFNIGIAADDFGCGYAGIERIIKIRPGIIKLDRILIKDIHNDKLKRAYVKGVLNMAKDSGALVLAEGVELWEEAKILKQMGIDLVQGYLFHKPEFAEVIRKKLKGTS